MTATPLNSFYNKFLFVLTIVPVIFQDLPLENYFGTIARCPVIFIAPTIFCLLLIQEQKFSLNSVPKYYLIYYGVTVITSILMMFFTVLFITNGTWTVYSEFFPLKLFKASIYSLVFFLFAYNGYNLIQKVSIQFVLNVLQTTLICLLIYGFIEFFVSYPIEFIHNNFIEEWKTRLMLTGSEPSSTMLMFSCVAYTTIGLRVYLKKSIVFTILLSILCLIILLGIGSKGGIVFIVVSLLWVLRKNFSFKTLLIVSLLSVPFIYYFIYSIIPQLVTDIESFASFSTRTTTMLVAIKSLFMFPLGQGYGTYLAYFPKMLLPMNNFLANTLNLPLLTFEIDDMLSTGKYLGVKSGILQEVLYNGFIAIAFFYYLFKNYFRQVSLLNKKNTKIIFLFIGVFCLIELLFTAEELTSYYYLLPFILLSKMTNTKKNLKANEL